MVMHHKVHPRQASCTKQDITGSGCGTLAVRMYDCQDNAMSELQAMLLQPLRCGQMQEHVPSSTLRKQAGA